MEEKNTILPSLLEIMGASEEPEELSEKLIDLFKDLINWTGWVLLILDEDTKQFEFVRVKAIEEKAMQEIKDLIEEGIIDWVIEKEIPMHIPAVDQSLNSHNRSFFVVPLLTDNRKIGAMIAVCPYRKDSLDQTSQSLITLLARQVALRIDNSLRYRKLTRQEGYEEKEQLVFSGILHGVRSYRKIREILRHLLALTLDRTRSEYGFILKINEKKKRLSPWVSLNVSLSKIKECNFSFTDGVTGWIVSKKNPIMVDDYQKDIRFRSGEEFTGITPRNLVGVPLKVEEEILGILILCNTLGKPYFTLDDLNFLLVVGGFTAVIIKNKLLYEELRRSFLDTIKALIRIIEAKDLYTSGHSHTVTRYALEIGRVLKLSREQMEMLKFCGILHDIGKIGIHDSILNKPFQLSPEEYELVKQHTLIGERIVKQIKFLKPGAPVIRHHHERYDGKGYPDGLKGRKIPLLARILSVADAFDAMLSDRPYRKGLPLQKVIKELKAKAGSQFDPEIVKIFCEIVEKRSRR